MDMSDPIIPLYVSHEGTIRISGSTAPRKSGVCALSFLEKGFKTIDFMCIGANANHQATKGMSVFCYMVDQNMKGKLTVAFKPLRFQTETTHPVTGEKKLKDCTIWRTLLFEVT
jgi:hypothetical protein